MGVIGYFYFQPPNNTEIDRLNGELDSLSILILKDKLTIQKLLIDAETTENKELEYLKKADSLAKIISTLNIHDDCPKIVEVQGKEIKTLRNGLEQCNKAKTIYVKTLGICQEVVVKYEIKEITQDELNKSLMKTYKKEKKKSFLFGAGAGGLAVLLIFLL